jgi:predicted dithiol-disulfide oxidoreductase (DUF899 family)
VSLPEIVSPQDWIAARKQLLAEEKQLLQRQDALNTARRRLPMVAIVKDYRFEGPWGELGLRDLFQGRRQLVLQHFMFGPDWENGCSGCTASVDEVSPGLLAHLNSRETSFALVSRAPIEKLEAYKAKRGWQLDWYSSLGSDFNYDFQVTHDESVAPIEYNFRTAQELIDRGEPWAARPGEQGGVSVFFRDGDTVLRTWSGYGPVSYLFCETDILLDSTPLGRQDETVDLVHHDKYPQ